MDIKYFLETLIPWLYHFRIPDWNAMLVGAIFLLSSSLTIYLILRRPNLYIRMRKRKFRVESYFLGSLLGPALILAFGLLRYHAFRNGLNGEGGMNPFGILVLFLSMVFMSIYLDITGFFEFCARLALKYAKADGWRLFVSLYITVSILTIFTSNDIIILTFTPFIYYFAKNAGIDPKPYLVAEFFAANTWSIMLYIGNPTNILMASAFRMRFMEYTKWMLLPTLAAGSVNFLILSFLFKGDIDKPIRIEGEIRPADAITDLPGALIGLIILSGCILLLALAPYIGVQMWIVSLIFGLALMVILLLRDSSVALLRRTEEGKRPFMLYSTLYRMPWSVVPFVLSLFITVEALRLYGIIGNIGGVFMGVCGSSIASHTFLYGITSALSANVLNNIPMTVAFVSIIKGLPHSVGTKSIFAASMATTIGSNLGANFTPIGALAGIMWMSILKDKELDLTFSDFVKYGLLVTPVSLLSALTVLSIQLRFF